MHTVQGRVGQIELLQQEVRQKAGAARRDFQAHRLSVMALLKALPQGGAQIPHILLVQGQVGVARHPELRELRHLSARKQVIQMRTHDAGQADEQHPVGRHLLRHADQTGQGTRHLDDSDFILAAKGIMSLETHNEVQRLIGHLRKRVGWIESHRDQQGADLAGKIFMSPAPLLCGPVAMRHDMDAMPRKRRDQHLVVQRILTLHQVMNLGGQRLKRRCGVDALGLAFLRRRDVRCRTHLKEFVEVGRDDAQIAQPLQQRHIRTDRPVEHAFIERENAVVTVQKHMGSTACDRLCHPRIAVM